MKRNILRDEILYEMKNFRREDRAKSLETKEKSDWKRKSAVRGPIGNVERNTLRKENDYSAEAERNARGRENVTNLYF